MSEVIVLPEKKIEVAEPTIMDPFNGRFIKVPVDEQWDNKGTRLVARYFNMPISMPIFEDIYQRSLVKSNLKMLEAMILETGRPWSTMDLTINTRYGTVNGNHRVFILRKIGWPTIPQVNMMDFRDEVAEAEFFIDINKISTQIKKDHYIWRARFVAKQIPGLILYSLIDTDEESMLFDRVSTAERPATKSRMNINTAWHIICKCGLDYQTKFEVRKESLIVEKLEKIGYGALRNNINNFMKWFILCHKEKDQRSPAWKNKVLLAHIQYFNMLKKVGMLSTESRYKQTIKKSNEFSLTPQLLELDQHNILREMVIHFNRKRKPGNKYILDIPSRN